jgi:hypothetical protein
MRHLLHEQVTGTASDKAADLQGSAADAASKAHANVKYGQKVASSKAEQARQAAGDYASSAQETAEAAHAKGSSTWQKVKDTVRGLPLLALSPQPSCCRIWGTPCPHLRAESALAVALVWKAKCPGCTCTPDGCTHHAPALIRKQLLWNQNKGSLGWNCD